MIRGGFNEPADDIIEVRRNNFFSQSARDYPVRQSNEAKDRQALSAPPPLYGGGSPMSARGGDGFGGEDQPPQTSSLLVLLNLLWIVLLLISIAFGVLSTLSNTWLQVPASVNSTWTSFGLTTYCPRNSPCHTFGSLDEVPFVEWQVALVFFAAGLLVTIAIICVALLGFRSEKASKAARVGLLISNLFLLIAILCYWGSHGEFNQSSTKNLGNQGINTCGPQARMFNLNYCSLGTGAIFSLVCFFVNALATIIGFALKPAFARKKKASRIAPGPHPW